MKKLRKCSSIESESWVDQAELLSKSILANPKNPDAYLQLTTLLENNDRAIEALDFYSQGLREIPGHGLLQMNYGLLLYKLGETESAKILMQVAKDLLTSPDSEELKALAALKALGQSQLKMKKTGQACKTYKELVRLQPDNVLFNYTYASLLLQQHDYPESQKYFQYTLELGDFESKPIIISKTYLNLAYLKAKDPREEGFTHAYLSALRLNPQLNPVFFHFSSLMESDTFEKSLLHYQTYFEVMPDSPWRDLSLCRMGMIQNGLGNAHAAQDLFLQALELNAECVLALYQLSFICVEKQEWEQSFAYLMQAFELHDQAALYNEYRVLDFVALLETLKSKLGPHEPSLNHQPAFALICLHAGDFESAVKLFNALVEKEDSPRIQFFLAAALQGKGELKQAEALYQDLLSRENFSSSPQMISVIYQNLASIQALNTMDEHTQKAYDEAFELNPKLTPQIFCFKRLMEESQDYKQTLILYQAYLEATPQDLNRDQILCYVGQFLRENRNFDEAIEMFSEAVRTQSDCVLAYFQMAIVQFETEEQEGVRSWIERAIVYQKDAHMIQFKLFNSFAMLNNPPEVQEQFQSYQEQHAKTLLKLAIKTNQWRETGNYEKAIKEYNQFIKLVPTQIEALCFKARALNLLRRNQEAYEVLKPVIDAGYLHADVAEAYAMACLHTKRLEESKVYLDRILACPELHFAYRRKILFTIGQMHDKAKHAKEAFAYFVDANAIKSQFWNPQKQEDRTSILMRVLNRENLSKLPRGNHAARPVFVVGMPRSGTTLTEQILCSHPDVFGAGEIGHLFSVFMKLIQPLNPGNYWKNNNTHDHYVDNFSGKLLKYLLNMPFADLADAAEDYTNHMESLTDRKGYTFIVNKMPGNFLYLGLIQLLFPNAIVIHCRRHPLDTCLSNFSIDFKSLRFTNNLEHLGRYYQQYQRIMKHWEQELDLSIFNATYEETIADQEAMSRRLIALLGLEWDAQCLSFYKTDRHVKTASYEQVRKPIYTSSVARYKPYEEELSPLKQWIDLSEWD